MKPIYALFAVLLLMPSTAFASAPIADIVEYSLNPSPDMGPINPTTHLILTIIAATGASAAAIYLLLEAKKFNTVIPILMLLGTVVSLWFEPFLDMMVGIIYPSGNLAVAVRSFGRNVPWYDTLAYFYYFPVAMWMFMKKFDEGAPASYFWQSYAFIVALTLVIELPFIAVGAWVYYGQPLMVAGMYPFFVAFWAAPCLFGGGYVLHKLKPSLTGNRVLVVIPLIPMLILGFSTAVLYPYSTTLNMPPNTWLQIAGGTVTAIFSMTVMWLLVSAHTQSNSLAASQKEG